MNQFEHGERLGRYQLRGVLGRGGFAVVYRAWDTVLNREVALKALLPHLAADETIRRRFLDEAKSLARLHHRCIVPVHDFDDGNGKPYFTMEIVTGQTVADLLADGGLPLERVAAILADLGSAIDYLHSSGLVHRDIKAANVMIDRTGRVLLMDFGIVRVLDGTRYTSTTGVLGSPEAVSPELVRGEQIGPFADIYALGVLAYQMLAGRPPFVGETMRLLYAHAHEPPPSLRGVRPGLPESVYAALDSALAKQPAQRPSSAARFAEAFRGPSSTSQPVVVPIQPAGFAPPPASNETVIFASERFAPPTQQASAPASITPPTMQFPGFPLPSPAPPAPQATVSAPPPRKRFIGLTVVAALMVVAIVAGSLLTGVFRGGAQTAPVTATVGGSLPATPQARVILATATPTVTPTVPPPTPIVADLKLFNNSSERRESEFEGGQRFAACFDLQALGPGQLVVLATDRDERPNVSRGSGILARSAPFDQRLGEQCRDVNAIDGSLSPGEYWAWVMAENVDLARGRFRVLAESTPTPSATPEQTATPAPAGRAPTVVPRAPTQAPRVAPTQAPAQQPAAPTAAPPAPTVVATQLPAAPAATAPPVVVPQTQPQPTAPPVVVPIQQAPPVVVAPTQPPQGACTPLLGGGLRCLQDP